MPASSWPVYACSSIPGTDDVAGVAVVPLLGHDIDVVHFSAGSCWSYQALVVDEPAARRPGTAPISM